MLSKPEAGDFRDEITKDNSEIENGEKIIWSSRVSFEVEYNICGLHSSSNRT